VFEIGRALNGRVDVEAKELFGRKHNLRTISFAQQATVFYLKQLLAAKKAVNTWSMIARRNGVVKDIRCLIGKMIWSKRNEAEYKL
jgi:hypothetical protein